MLTEVSATLLSWYDAHARVLPWRDHPEAYAIWVSEIMLQQTRVETVIPYFKRWMALFPTVHALAQASPQEVLSAWEGLGYYSRARNLHKAAQILVQQYDGLLPSDPRLLRNLPGIGRYTAGAIASMAFGLDEVALDGNIRRVLARLFDLSLPVRSPQGERRLLDIAAAHLPPGKAGDFNQALMDLGALVCTARRPACPLCPLATQCRANALGNQAQRPLPEAKSTIPHYTVTAGVIRRQEQVLITQRPANGLLGGLWEFPGGKQLPGEDLQVCLQRELCEELGVDIQVGDPLGVYRHAYTHFRVTLHAFYCCLIEPGQPRPLQVNDLRWVQPGELPGYPMGKIDRQIATHLLKDHNLERSPC